MERQVDAYHKSPNPAASGLLKQLFLIIITNYDIFSNWYITILGLVLCFMLVCIL